MCNYSTRAGIARWKERRTRDQKLRVRIPAGAVKEFSSPESSLCADTYSMYVPPFTTVARKRARPF